MTDTIRIQPLTAEAFAPFGDVLDCAGDPTKLINNGMCGRYHDRAKLDFSDGRAGISLFKAKLRALPMRLELVERHPEGSQAFLPLDSAPFVVVVAPDEYGGARGEGGGAGGGDGDALHGGSSSGGRRPGWPATAVSGS
mgnify:CR=1 FL=1